MKVRCLNCMREYDDEYELCPHCGFVVGTAPKELYHLHPGMLLADRYLVGTVVGFGGFGIVYRAWDTKLEIMVCLKEYFPAAIVTRTPGQKRVIPLGKSNRQEEYRRNLELFIDEARNTAKFNTHPNIVNVFNYFEENGTAYMVMEFLDGETLKAFLKESGGTIEVDVAINILLSVISALKAVHKQGILHRDISPDNIFLCADGNVKLIDFGAAKFADDEKEKTREVVLKPGYAPPEQYQTKSVQAPWTDIYALGATMYRAITGEVPQESTNRLVEDQVKPPKEIRPEIPDYIDSALMRAMSVTPEFRFKNVQEFEDAIVGKKIMRSEKEQRRFLLRKRLLMVSCVLVMILIGAGISYRDYHNKKVAAQLEECTISMWMPVAEEDISESQAQRMAEGLTSEFKADYENVTVEIEYVPESEYESRLREAFESDSAPTVFLGNAIDESELEYAAEIGDVIELLDKGAYAFLGKYNSYYPQQRQVPTGFTFSVMYCNTNLRDSGESLEASTLEAFLNEDAAYYVGNVMDYNEIQSSLPGLYEISELDAGEYPGEFVWEWSVNSKQSEEQINAGKRLIYYFLGENAQDVMYVQNSNGLPLNKNMLYVFEDVNKEWKFVDKAVDKIKIEK